MTGFEPTTSVIITMPKAMCYRCEYIYIYILACASVTIYNIIYVFNINFRKLDGQYRSWIEYLNERY